MERDSQILTQLAEDYHLDINGVKVWTPYWINRSDPPFFLNAPFDGKGTPSELKSAFIRRLEKDNQRPNTAEGYRRLMQKWGIGVDCSGLAYFLLSHWLRQTRNLRLADYIYVPKTDVVQASQRPHWRKAGVSKAHLDSLPDQVTVAEVCRLFKRLPARATNVDRLTSSESAMTVDNVKAARPGDMIKLSGIESVHIGIVVSVRPDRITYVDSSREWGQFGGVRFEDIVIKDPLAGLEQQEWEDKRFFFADKGDRLCRLKVIDAQG